MVEAHLSMLLWQSDNLIFPISEKDIKQYKTLQGVLKMGKNLKLALLFSTALVIMLLTACGNDSNNENNNNNNASTNNDDVTILSLGEKGIMKNHLGEYEVTIESFEVFDNFNGQEPEHDDHIFMVVDLTVKNVGDNILEGDDITGPMLYTAEGNSTGNDFSEEGIDQIKNELHPGDVDSGQMIFYSYESDDYELNFGDRFGSISNEIIWKFNKSEAK